tara:strand:+ start:121 stop:798 length:678 start_codon:yes stop_codon:yes gene_type:complete
MSNSELELNLQRVKDAGLGDTPVELRHGDDGYFGRLFEASLGIEENNRSGVDCVEANAELKTKRKGSSARTSLFSMEPTWGISPRFPNLKAAIQYFKNDTNRMNICCSTAENNHHLRLQLEGDDLFLLHREEKICQWSTDALKTRASEKLVNMILCEHDRELGPATIEKYTSFKPEKFLSLIEMGNVVVEFRISIKAGNKVKNRGTCFRTPKRYLSQMYERTCEL